MAEALEPILPQALVEQTERLLSAACKRDLTLATAESCTGGLVASLLTDVPGCSHAFERGFVTYTDEAKHEMLGVPLALMADGGVVSKDVVLAMAQGALEASRADVAFAVTGWTEDVGDPKRPAGRVHFACQRRGSPAVHRHREFGDVGRARLRLLCLQEAADMLEACVSKVCVDADS